MIENSKKCKKKRKKSGLFSQKKKRSPYRTIASLFVFINLVRLIVSDDYRDLELCRNPKKMFVNNGDNFVFKFEKNPYKTCRNYFRQQDKKKKN